MTLISKESVLIQFKKDIEQIAEKIIADLKIKHSKEMAHLSSPLIRLLDFRNRYIEPKKRQFIFSVIFPKKLPIDVERSLNFLLEKSFCGNDLNPYQSKTLTNIHDSSSKKKQNRTDRLWAEWDMYHFHLTTEPIKTNEYYSKRSDWLMFCLVFDNYIAVIDVRKHDEGEDEYMFSNPDLIEIAARSFPNWIHQFELNGISTIDSVDCAEDIEKRRKNGITKIIALNNKAYFPPNLGLSAAATPTKINIQMMRLSRWLKLLAEMVCSQEQQFMKTMAQLNITEPLFTLQFTPRGLAVFEEKSNIGFLMTSETSSTNFLANIQNILLPNWFF